MQGSDFEEETLPDSPPSYSPETDFEGMLACSAQPEALSRSKSGLSQTMSDCGQFVRPAKKARMETKEEESDRVRLLHAQRERAMLLNSVFSQLRELKEEMVKASNAQMRARSMTERIENMIQCIAR